MNNKDPDQVVQLCCLIWIFTGLICLEDTLFLGAVIIMMHGSITLDKTSFIIQIVLVLKKMCCVVGMLCNCLAQAIPIRTLNICFVEE